MKPDWKDAPEWANWLAQDGNGDWVWCDEEPAPSQKGPWWKNYGQISYSNHCLKDRYDLIVFDWQDTLEPRPTEKTEVTEVEMEYVDPYDQKLEPGDVTVDDAKKKINLNIVGVEVIADLLPGEEIVSRKEPDTGMEVQEGAVMNTPGYEELAGVLVRAYDQAASGKGKERHADDKAFVGQPMQTISDLLDSDAGMAFQAIKKIKEARGLPTREAQVRELLGSIVYVAGMVLWLEKQPPVDSSGATWIDPKKEKLGQRLMRQLGILSAEEAHRIFGGNRS